MTSIFSDVPAFETDNSSSRHHAFAARDVGDAAPKGDSPAPRGDAYVIEASDVAAGIIVRQKGGYRFFASHENFQLLDGSVFKNPRAAQAAAELMHRAAARDLAARRRSELAGFTRDLPWS